MKVTDKMYYRAKGRGGKKLNKLYQQASEKTTREEEGEEKKTNKQ